jgi:hypothetical protein
MKITAAMHRAALESLADDPLACRLVEAFWRAPVIEEVVGGGGRPRFTVAGKQYPDATSAYVACIEGLGRSLAAEARL